MSRLNRLCFILMSVLFLLPLSPLQTRGASEVRIAKHPLPHVSPRMEEAAFWLNKIPNPQRILLKPEEIQRMNEANLKKSDLYLFSVKEMKDDFSRDEIVDFFKEDWQGFGRPEEPRYGSEGNLLTEAFWNGLKSNLNQESLKDRNQVRFGLIVKRTNLRVFPTDESCKMTSDRDAFDLFQHSSLSPGSLIGIYCFSRDRQWAYVQTYFVRAWVRAEDLAVAREKKEATDYEDVKDRWVITGSFARVFQDPSLQQVAFLAQMGASFPSLDPTARSETAEPYFVIRIPFRESRGQLSFRKGYLPRKEDIHHGFLPYTQQNVATQAFKMLHEPYGWGEKPSGRDCSRFTMDIFGTFGIVLPRNSKYQAMIGKRLGEMERKKVKEKGRILDRALPLATLLRLPGHIMLYLGKDRGRYYAIHSIWGMKRSGPSGEAVEKIAKVEVSDLTLGRRGPHGSLLDRLTEITSIGQDSNSP